MWIGAFTATHIPKEELPEIQFSFGVLHILGFAGLVSWFILTLAAYRVGRRQRVIRTLVTMLIYSSFDEYTQQFFHRSSDLPDVVRDMAGTVLAIIIWELVSALAAKGRSPASHSKLDRQKEAVSAPD
jgi:VanZ family protein